MPITALAIGAGVGLLKSQTVDKDKEERQRKLASETQRYSPWTHLQAQPIQEADPVGTALQYGATGAQMQQGFQNAGAQQGLIQAQTNWLDRGGSPAATAAAAQTVAPAGGLAYESSSNLYPQAGSNPWRLGADYGSLAKPSPFGRF